MTVDYDEKVELEPVSQKVGQGPWVIGLAIVTAVGLTGLVLVDASKEAIVGFVGVMSGLGSVLARRASSSNDQ